MCIRSCGFSVHKILKMKLPEKRVNARLPDHLSNPEPFQLVKIYQVHSHSRISWKYHKNEFRFSYGPYFTEKAIIAKPFGFKFSSDEKEEVLIWRSTVLRQIKSYVDNNFNLDKANVIDPTKDNLTTE